MAGMFDVDTLGAELRSCWTCANLEPAPDPSYVPTACEGCGPHRLHHISKEAMTLITPTSGAAVPVESPAQAPIVNPKELAGSKKPAIWNVVPRWVVALVGRVMSVGAAKYGRFNYRDSNVSAMTYVDAMERHLQLWQDGEDKDEETGVSHLASVMASCAILLDAQANGRLGDDRPKTGLARKTLDELQELLVSLPLPKPQY